MHFLRLFRESRRFRTASMAIFFLGCLSASIVPYQGLITVKLFGFSDASFAAIMVIGAALSAVISVAIGILTDQRWPRRTTALITSAIGGAGMAAVWLTESPWAYLVSATITNPVGISIMGQMYAVARMAVADEAVEVRDGAMATVRAGFAIPFLVILPIWSFAFQQGASFIYIYAATAASSLGIFLSVLFLMPRDGTEGGVEIRSGLTIRAALAELVHPRISSRVLLVATLVSANSVYMATMGLLFVSVHPEGASRTAWFAGLIAGMEVPFMLLIPILSARFAKSSILLGASVIYAVFLLLFPSLAAGPYVWGLVILAGAGAAVLLTIPIAYFQDLLSSRPGTASSLQPVQMVTSQLIAGGVFWLGTTISGYALVMWIGGALSVVSGLLLWMADRRA